MSKKPFQWLHKKPSNTEIVLQGAQVILRDKRLDDAPDDYRWRTDEELSRLDDAKPLSMSFEDFLDLYKEELHHPSPWSRRLAIDTLDGKHIGNCMYYDVDHIRHQTEVGIMVGAKEYWGQGYGTDAMTTLVDYIFHTTDLRRVYLHTLERNVRARGSFAKVGFTEVKLVPRNNNMFVQMEIWRNGSKEQYNH